MASKPFKLADFADAIAAARYALKNGRHGVALGHLLRIEDALAEAIDGLGMLMARRESEEARLADLQRQANEAEARAQAPEAAAVGGAVRVSDSAKAS